MDKNEPSKKKKYPPPYSIRFSEEERTLLEKLRNGIPLAKFLKSILFSATLRLPTLRKLSAEDQKLIAQVLAKLGKTRLNSNVNQLARAANSGSLPMHENVEKILSEILELLRWIKKTLIKALHLKEQEDDDDAA